MSETKETKHNIIVRVISKKEITYAAAVFILAASIDTEELEDEGLLILGYDFNDAEPGTHTKTEKTPSKTASRISDLLSRSPGALGDLYARYGWKGLYIGGAAAILFATLLWKFFVRTITGNW